MKTFYARASISGYVVLSGIWFALASLFLWCAIFRASSEPQNIESARLGMLSTAALCTVVGLLWCAWLKGFRLQVSSGVLEYRNGLYQTQRVKIKDIQRVSSKWIEWRVLWRRITVPRMVIELRDAHSIAINIKPFSRPDLARLKSILSGHTSCAT
jgi:hypothetical protein